MRHLAFTQNVRGEAKTRVKRTLSLLGLLVTAIVSLVLNSCIPSQWEYLINANDRATQGEVRRQMGAPNLMKSLRENESIWTYRHEVSSSFVGRRGDMVGGQRCIEYVLTFDAQQVLRHWVRQPC